MCFIFFLKNTSFLGAPLKTDQYIFFVWSFLNHTSCQYSVLENLNYPDKNQIIAEGF